MFSNHMVDTMDTYDFDLLICSSNYLLALYQIIIYLARVQATSSLFLFINGKNYENVLPELNTKQNKTVVLFCYSDCGVH